MMRELEQNWMDEVKPPVEAAWFAFQFVRNTSARVALFADAQHACCRVSETVFGRQEAHVFIGEDHAPMLVNRSLAAGLIPYLMSLVVYGHINEEHVERFRPLRVVMPDGEIRQMTVGGEEKLAVVDPALRDWSVPTS